MNWIGGSRNRVQKTSDRKKQQLYFEKKRSIQDSKGNTKIAKKSIFGLSQDLIFLQTASKVYKNDVKSFSKDGSNCKENSNSSHQRPKVVDLSPKEAIKTQLQQNGLCLSPKSSNRACMEKKFVSHSHNLISKSNQVYNSHNKTCLPSSEKLSFSQSSQGYYSANQNIPSKTERFPSIKSQQDPSIKCITQKTNFVQKQSTGVLATEKNSQHKMDFLSSSNSKKSFNEITKFCDKNRSETFGIASGVKDDIHAISKSPSYDRIQVESEIESQKNNRHKTKEVTSKDELLFMSLFDRKS